MSHSSANGTQSAAQAASTSQGAGQDLINAAQLLPLSQDLPSSLMDQESDQRTRLLAFEGGRGGSQGPGSRSGSDESSNRSNERSDLEPDTPDPVATPTRQTEAAGELFRKIMSRLVAHMNSSPESRQADAELEPLEKVALESVAESAATTLFDDNVELILRAHKLFWRQSLFHLLASVRSLLVIAGLEPAKEGDEEAAEGALLASALIDRFTKLMCSMEAFSTAGSEESSSSATVSRAASVLTPRSLESLDGRAQYRLYWHMLDDMRQNDQLADLVLVVPGARIPAHYQALVKVLQYCSSHCTPYITI